LPRLVQSFPHSASSIACLTTNNHAEVCTLSRRDDVSIPVPTITARRSLPPLSHICTSVGSPLRLTYPWGYWCPMGGVQTYPVPLKATDVRLRTHPSTGSTLVRVAVPNRPPTRLLALLAWLVSIREPIICNDGAVIHLCCPYRSAWQRRRRDARRVATLSAELHTQGSPLTHVCLGYCWRNSRFWHLHWGQNNCFRDFWSHIRLQIYK
jgi:hypothetical protein